MCWGNSEGNDPHLAFLVVGKIMTIEDHFPFYLLVPIIVSAVQVDILIYFLSRVGALFSRCFNNDL
jgi:hypothetical protein